MDTKTILPCLQSVCSQWTNDDKLCFSYYIKHIFGLEDAYFVPLFPNHTQNMVTDQMEQFALSVSGVSRNLSCTQLRSVNFSFGHLNKHLCFICPYSGIYKNSFYDREKILLYYQLALYDLQSLLEKKEKKLDDIIQSYYPVYQNEILVDALPLSFLGHFFTFDGRPILTYLENPDEFVSLHVAGIQKAVSKRVSMQKRKSPYYLAEDPDAYEAAVFACSQKLYREIVSLDSTPMCYVNPIKPLDAVTVIDARMVQRIFSVLADSRTRYMPVKPEDYPAPELRKIEEPKCKPECEKLPLNLASEHLHPVSEANKICEATGVKTKRPEDIISQDIEVADGFLDNSKLDEEKEIDYSSFLSLVNSDDQKNDKEVHALKTAKCSQIDPTKKNDLSMQGFYLLDKEKWYGHPNTSDAFNFTLRSIYQSSTYLCLECAIYDGRKGLLLMGSEGIFVFYPINDYGPREIKKLFSKRIPLYTYHSFEVAAYLHSNKLYELNLHDISIVYDYLNRKPFGATKNLCEKMKGYESSYRTAFNGMKDRDRKQIRLLEKFQELIASNGQRPPFYGMEHVYEKDSDGVYVTTYTSELRPEVKGVFYWLHVDLPDQGRSVHKNWRHIYMEICVRLNKYLPFEKGLAYILQLDENGFLIYVNGISFLQIEAGEYLKACTRRVIRDTFGLKTKYDTQIRYQNFCPADKDGNGNGAIRD